MKILDRYIVRQFLTTFLFALAAFIVIFIVIDLIEHLGEFVDKGVKMPVIVRYYVVYSPEIVNYMIPVAALLSGLFVTGKLANQMELSAIKSAGTSLYRIVLPFVATAAVISGVAVWFNGWIVPQANAAKARIEAMALGRGSGDSAPRTNIVRQERGGRLIQLGYYDSEQRTAFTVSLDRLDGSRLLNRVDADRLSWRDDRWVAERGTLRDFGTDPARAPKLIAFDELDTLTIGFTPEDLTRNYADASLLTLPRLNDFIDSQKRSGVEDLDKLLVNYHARLSLPFASLIVVLFGVALASQKKRGGLAVNFGLALMIGFVYLIFLRVSQTFGYSGAMPPIVAAWFANLIFLVAGLVTLRRASQQS